jgi:hypothetical protein
MVFDKRGPKRQGLHKAKKHGTPGLYAVGCLESQERQKGSCDVMCGWASEGLIGSFLADMTVAEPKKRKKREQRAEGAK